MDQNAFIILGNICILYNGKQAMNLKKRKVRFVGQIRWENRKGEMMQLYYNFKALETIQISVKQVFQCQRFYKLRFLFVLIFSEFNLILHIFLSSIIFN